MGHSPGRRRKTHIMSSMHNVNFIPQHNEDTCWFACMKMLAGYELSRGTARDPVRLKRFMNLTLEDLASAGMDGAAGDDVIRLQAGLIGMHIEPFAPTYTEGSAFLGTGGEALGGMDLRMITMENLLNHKPFGLPCRVPAGSRARLHVIVIRGYADEDDSGPEPMHYWYLDPAADPVAARASALPYERLIQEYIPDGGYVFTY